MPNPRKAIIIIVSVLIVVLFYESKRIESISPGIKNPVLKQLAVSFASSSEGIKSFLGLTDFFKNEEIFWSNLKKSPKIFSYSENNNQKNNIPISTPIPTLLPLKLTAPYKIIIVGDSFIAERFGPQLEKIFLLYKDTEVYRKGIYSTGLSRPDYFDWNKQLKEIISEQKPNVAVVMFGANDGQDQRTLDGKVIHYGNVEWNIEYAKRVSAFLDIMRENNIFVFWIGNPIARDDYYKRKMETQNSIYEAESQKYNNVVYISTQNMLLDANGKYSAYLPDENGKMQLARTSDGIHTTVFGAEILVNGVLNEIKKKMELELIEIPK